MDDQKFVRGIYWRNQGRSWAFYSERHGRRVTVAGDRQSALDAQAKDRLERDVPLLVQSKLTVEQLAAEVIADREAQGRPTHSLTADKIGVKWVNSRIGHLPVSKITPGLVSKLRADFDEGVVTGRVLKPSTTDRHLSILRTVFGRAVTKGILANNPFSSLEPRYKRPASVKRFTWSRETIEAILDAARLHSAKKTTLLNYLPYVAVLAYTGLRAGEGLALTWGDIDLLNSRLTVGGTLQRDMTIGSAKTAASHRTIPVPAALVDILVEAKPVDAEDNWFVLSSRFEPTKPVSYNNLRSRGWTQILKLAGLSESGITLHSLRHATASLLIDAGLAPTDVAKHLGHANAGVTMTVYAQEFGTQEERETRIRAAFEEQMTA